MRNRLLIYYRFKDIELINVFREQYEDDEYI